MQTSSVRGRSTGKQVSTLTGRLRVFERTLLLGAVPERDAAGVGGKTVPVKPREPRRRHAVHRLTTRTRGFCYPAEPCSANTYVMRLDDLGQSADIPAGDDAAQSYPLDRPSGPEVTPRQQLHLLFEGELPNEPVQVLRQDGGLRRRLFRGRHASTPIRCAGVIAKGAMRRSRGRELGPT